MSPPKVIWIPSARAYPKLLSQGSTGVLGQKCEGLNCWPMTRINHLPTGAGVVHPQYSAVHDLASKGQIGQTQATSSSPVRQGWRCKDCTGDLCGTHCASIPKAVLAMAEQAVQIYSVQAPNYHREGECNLMRCYLGICLISLYSQGVVAPSFEI